MSHGKWLANLLTSWPFIELYFRYSCAFIFPLRIDEGDILPLRNYYVYKGIKVLLRSYKEYILLLLSCMFAHLQALKKELYFPYYVVSLRTYKGVIFPLLSCIFVHLRGHYTFLTKLYLCALKKEYILPLLYFYKGIISQPYNVVLPLVWKHAIAHFYMKRTS